ncbi:MULTISPECIES: flippase [Salinibaculum]|uniref:flippase n=1 Tax=Salinibaculum TaxID=2732368 RepID=UPI0030CCCDC6
MSSDEDADYSEIRAALGSIGLSAVLIFGATLLSQGLGFLTRVTMARYLPVDGYGIVVIGLSVLNLFGLVALAGMPAALSRYLPRRETADERRRILSSAFQIVGVLSVITGAGIFLTAKLLATAVFGNPDLVWIIRIFAAILPFYAIFKMGLGGFRGYETTYPRILTQNVLRPGLQLAGILLFVSLGYGTTGIAFAYASAFVVAAAVGMGLLYRVSEFSAWEVLRRGSISRHKELLLFSVPLAASGAINVVAKHSDLILLGMFKSGTEVGLYEVAFRMGVFVTLLFTPAIGYLFQPIISRFDANADRGKMDKLYTVTTRWIVVASFPVFALFFLFPEQSLAFFFSEKYVASRWALRILLVGFVISLLPGLTGMFLTAVGETKILMYISAGTMFLNVAINVILIPSYGIIGAAIATATARIFNNVVQSYFIYRKYTVHPFNRGYVIPTALMGIVFVLLFAAPIPFSNLSFGFGVFVAVGIGVIHLTLVLVTRSIYSVELALIDGLLNRLGIAASISKSLQRFVR